MIDMSQYPDFMDWDAVRNPKPRTSAYAQRDLLLYILVERFGYRATDVSVYYGVSLSLLRLAIRKVADRIKQFATSMNLIIRNYEYQVLDRMGWDDEYLKGVRLEEFIDKKAESPVEVGKRAALRRIGRKDIPYFLREINKSCGYNEYYTKKIAILA